MIIKALAKLERRASFRNPIEDWLRDALVVGPPTKSGVPVTEDSALNFSAVYAAIRVIAESCAQLPFPVYRRLPDGTKERMKTNQVDKLLNEQFNSATTAYLGRETVTAFGAGWGNGFAQISFDGAIRPSELEPIPSRFVQVDKNEETGDLIYTISKPHEKAYQVGARMMLHIPALSFDGVSGRSPLRMAREAVGLGLATEQHGSQFFGQGARPGGVIYHPGHFKDQAARDRFRDTWESVHGHNHAHKTAVLEDGIKWEPVGIPNEDAQFLETRKFQVTEIARWFGIPPHMIGDLAHATFSNIEQQSLEFVIYHLMPWLKRWEAEVNRKLLGADRNLVAEHNTAGFLRGDATTRAAWYKTMREIGTFSVNDVLALENMNSIGDEGDDRHIPMNWSVLGAEPPEPPPMPEPEPEEEPEEDEPVEDEPVEVVADEESGDQNSLRAFRPLLVDAFDRFLAKEVRAIGRATRKYDDNQAFRDYVLGFYRDHTDVVAESIGVLMGTIGACSGFSVDEWGVINRHIDTSRDLIVAKIDDRDALSGMLKAWGSGRAVQQADRELRFMGLHDE